VPGMLLEFDCGCGMAFLGGAKFAQYGELYGRAAGQQAMFGCFLLSNLVIWGHIARPSCRSICSISSSSSSSSSSGWPPAAVLVVAAVAGGSKYRWHLLLGCVRLLLGLLLLQQQLACCMCAGGKGMWHGRGHVQAKQVAIVGVAMQQPGGSGTELTTSWVLVEQSLPWHDCWYLETVPPAQHPCLELWRGV
jgi:hypothetical protein